jgi:SAM-dependent methyltransferase
MKVASPRWSQYYDLLYRDKNYGAEARWVDGLLRAGSGRVGTLLDLGCGTGAHAREFAQLGWQVTGVDISADMISLACQRTPVEAGIQYVTASAADFDLGRKFSAVVSLFHVASYQVGNGEMLAMIRNVRRHLVTDGRLAFDFWHGPGVLADPPVRRERRVENQSIRVFRTAEPTHHTEEHRIDVAYTVQIESLPDGEMRGLCEVHHLRYFFVPELVDMLQQAGFALECTFAGLGGAKLDDSAWYGFILARAL